MPRWSREQLARIREIQRDFHVRAFGEEMAGVNLDLTIQQRHEYLEWMRQLANQHGVPPTPRRFEDLEKELEAEEDRKSSKFKAQSSKFKVRPKPRCE
jgi:hypothetical protein